MSFKLVERDRAKTQIKVLNTITFLTVLIVLCSVLPATVFWFAAGDAELVQKAILVGSAVVAIIFGIVFGHALSPSRRPLRFRRGHRFN